MVDCKGGVKISPPSNDDSDSLLFAMLLFLLLLILWILLLLLLLMLLLLLLLFLLLLVLLLFSLPVDVLLTLAFDVALAGEVVRLLSKTTFASLFYSSMKTRNLSITMDILAKGKGILKYANSLWRSSYGTPATSEFLTFPSLKKFNNAGNSLGSLSTKILIM